MLASWVVWALSAVVVLGAIRFVNAMRGVGPWTERHASDFRTVAGGFEIIVLVATLGREDLLWHLLWLTPVTIILAYLYALRRLLAMVHRINRIAKLGLGLSDPEQIRQAVQREVDEYNRNAAEDEKLR